MTAPGPTALIVETTADEECPLEFLGESADIVYFISFAHSERYGAGHPLAKAAGLLKRRLGVDLKPLLIYADARAESSEEERALAASRAASCHIESSAASSSLLSARASA